MAKFVFELEALLRQRRRAEREQMGVVARIERERIALEDEIRGCQSSIVREKHELVDLLSSSKGEGGAREPVRLELAGVRAQANHSLSLITRAQKAVIRLRGVHRRLDAARLELLDRTTKRRAIEVLKEQRHDEWVRAQRKREQAEFDEISVLRHTRRDDPVDERIETPVTEDDA